LFLLTQETETALLRIDPSSKEVAYNPTFDQLFAPEVQLLQGLTVDEASAVTSYHGSHGYHLASL